VKVKEQNAILKKLKDIGIKALKYSNDPTDFDIFIMRKEDVGKGGEIRFWFGSNPDLKVKVSTNKSQRQAVLNVIEPEREIIQEYTFYAYSNQRDNLESLLDQATYEFPVRFPETVEDEVQWSFVENPTLVDQKDSNRDPYSRIAFKAKVKAIAPASEQSALVGVDESYHFISILPKSAKSVTEAHEILRPEGVTEDAYRQGEWFFQPVDQELSDILDSKASDLRELELLTEEESYNTEATHVATTGVEYQGKKYAIGFIIDVRGENHHGNLWLPEWCEVIRNTEVIMYDSQYYD
jgi:hypothetical protein